MTLRPRRRRNAVVWNANVTPLARSGGRAYSRSQLHWLFRTWGLLTVIQLLVLARAARTRWEPAGLVAGGGLTAAGFALPAAAAFFGGLLVLIVTMVFRISEQQRPRPGPGDTHGDTSR